MTSDHTNQKKKAPFPGWAVAIIVISTIVFFILLLIMIPKLYGINHITVTPQIKANSQKSLKKMLTQTQKAKISNFKKKYQSYITNVKNKNQGLSEFQINDTAASQIIRDLTSKEKFDIENYQQFLKQIPTDIKQKGMTADVIQAKEKTINDTILKDMNQYIEQTTNPTLNGAIAYIEKDSLENLIMKHTGRSQASYTQLYRPFYKKALQLKKNKNGQRNTQRNTHSK